MLDIIDKKQGFGKPRLGGSRTGRVRPAKSGALCSLWEPP